MMTVATDECETDDHVVPLNVDVAVAGVTLTSIRGAPDKAPLSAPPVNVAAVLPTPGRTWRSADSPSDVTATGVAPLPALPPLVIDAEAGPSFTTTSGWFTLPVAATVFWRLVTTWARPVHSWPSGLPAAELAHVPRPDASPWVSCDAPLRTGCRIPLRPTSSSPTSPWAAAVGHPPPSTAADDDAQPRLAVTNTGVPAGVPPPWAHEKGLLWPEDVPDVSETSSVWAPAEVSSVPVPSAWALGVEESALTVASPPEISLPKRLISRPVALAWAVKTGAVASAVAHDRGPVPATAAPATTPAAATARTTTRRRRRAPSRGAPSACRGVRGRRRAIATC